MIAKGHDHNVIVPENQFVWTAYMDLRNSNVVPGFGRGPIPMSEIKAYSDYFGLSEVIDKHRFMSLIHSMDRAERELNGSPNPRP
jgi:hypothetical protein